MSTFYGYEEDETVSKDYVDKIDERVVNKAGFLRTDIDMGSHLIHKKTVPVLSTELVNKKYVDDNSQHITFFRQWKYFDLRESIRYPRSSASGWPTFPISLNTISENACITIQSLISDDDGGGLDSLDEIDFYLRYVINDGTNPQSTHQDLIFTAQLSKYTRNSIRDQQSLLHCFTINHDYYLNQITNYKHIKLIYIGIKQSIGSTNGNECCLIVNYNDPK